MDSKNCEIIKNEQDQETQESVKSVEPIAETNSHDDIIKKLKEAEENIAKLEQIVNSKTDFIKLLEQQKINSEKELVQVTNYDLDVLNKLILYHVIDCS